MRAYSEVGNQQLLTLKSLSLQLNGDNFRADGPMGYLGYKRFVQPEFNQDATYNVSSLISFKGRRGPARYQFEWGLLLPVDKCHLLEAMVYLQRELISTFDTTPGCLLIDQRLVLPEYSVPVRQRAKYGEVDLGDPPISVPPGFEYIWPKFSIIFTEFTKELFIPKLSLYYVELKAKELNVVTGDS